VARRVIVTDEEHAKLLAWREERAIWNRAIDQALESCVRLRQDYPAEAAAFDRISSELKLMRKE
jgi:hypothetical protein